MSRKQRTRSFIAGVLVLAWVAGCVPVREEVTLARKMARIDTPALQHSVPEASELPEGAGLEACLRYAALHNPGLEAAFNRWMAALERVPQVTALSDPRFTYRVFIEEVETRVGPQRQSFALAQMFPWFGKLQLRGDVAMEAANAARQRYEAEKLKLFYKVKNAYYEYYYLARAIGIVSENLKLMEYVEQVALTRYKAAAEAYGDVIRAQVEVGKLDDRLRTLSDLRGPITARLNAAMNRPTNAPLTLPETIQEEKVEATDDKILAWLHENSPELKALEHKIAEARRGVALAGKNYFPDLTVGLTYIETGRALMPRTPDNSKDPIIAMFSINLPIWREKYRAGELEAKARHLAALKTKLDRENWLGAEVKMVLYNFADAERKIDLYRDTLVPKAEQALKTTETAYRAGKSSFLDIIDAERVLLEFQLSYERALANHAQRLAELEMLTGRSLPRRSAEEKPEKN